MTIVFLGGLGIGTLFGCYLMAVIVAGARENRERGRMRWERGDRARP